MLATYFKLIESKPLKITDAILSDKYICVIQDSRIISLCNSVNFQILYVTEVSKIITTSQFLTTDKIVFGTKCGHLLIFDLINLQIQEIQFDYEIKQLKIYEKHLYIQDITNTLHRIEIESLYTNYMVQPERVYQHSSDILCYEIIQKNIIIFDRTGYCKIYNMNSKECIEFYTSDEVVCNLTKIGIKNICCITTKGSIMVINIETESIVCKAKVRDSSINAIISVDNILFCAGEDNRLIKYTYVDNTLIKGPQVDSHSARVIKLLYDGSRILTVSDDFSIAVHKLIDTSFAFKKVYFDLKRVECSHENIFVNNYNSLDIFQQSRMQDDDKELVNYKNKMSLKTRETILSFKICENDYIAIRTISSLKIYKYFENEIILIQKIDNVVSFTFFECFLLYITTNKDLILYNLESKTIIRKTSINILLEDILVTKNHIFLSNNKFVYDINLFRKDLNIGLEVQNMIEINVKIYLLCYAPKKDINTDYKILQYDHKTNASFKLADLHQLINVEGMCHYSGSIYIYTHEKIVRYDICRNKITTSHVGPIIYGVFGHRNELYICQKDYKEILKSVESNNRLKIKFNKKLIIKT